MEVNYDRDAELPSDNYDDRAYPINHDGGGKKSSITHDGGGKRS